MVQKRNRNWWVSFIMKTVMILGAGYYMVPTIKTVRGMGLKALIVDKNPMAPGLEYADFQEVTDIRDIENCIKIAKRYNIDAVIPLNDYGVITSSAVSKSLGLIGISNKAAQISLDKSKWRKIFWDINIPSPHFKICLSAEDIFTKVLNFEFPLMLKPAISFGGCRGVCRVFNHEDFREEFDNSKKYSENGVVVVEESITGVEYTVDSIIKSGEILIYGIGENLKMGSDFPVNKGIIYPSHLSKIDYCHLVETIEKIVKSMGLYNCVLHLEVIIDEESNIYPIDLSLRCGAGGTISSILIPNAYGLNMMEAIINVYMGGEIETNLKPEYAGAVFWFLTNGRGKIKSITGLDDVRKLKNVLDCKLLVKTGDILGDIKSGLDRRGHIITKGKNREDAIKIAIGAESLIDIKTVEGDDNEGY